MLGQYSRVGAYRLSFLIDWAFTEEAILFGGNVANKAEAGGWRSVMWSELSPREGGQPEEEAAVDWTV